MDEYAALEQRLGTKVEKVGGIWWRQVRPLFYRPLLTHQPYSQAAIVPPCGRLGGLQYVLDDAGIANSTLDWLVLDHLRDYSLERLGHNRRRLVKLAMKSYFVRPINSAVDLQQGHAAYLSFFQRTGYGYRKDRAAKTGFDTWATTVCSAAKAIVLGGYEKHSDALKAVSVSYRLDDTLLYSTFFGESLALKHNLGELMFHEIRRLASVQTGLNQIIVRSYKGHNNQQDQYYLIRGCKLQRRPARLVLHPLTRTFLKLFLPTQYAGLLGSSRAAQSADCQVPENPPSLRD